LACGRSGDSPLPPPAVDLLAQADAAGEIVDAPTLAGHASALMASDPRAYLVLRLRSLGLAPGGPGRAWIQPFERLHRVARAVAPWVVQRGEQRAVFAGGRDLVAALGGRWGRVRLRGVQAVFVAPSLAAPPGALAGRVLVVLDPPPAAPGGAAPLGDLFRRAAAAGAHAVLVLPRPGVTATLPHVEAAAAATAGSGIPVAVWLTDAAARELLRALAGTSLEAMVRLEWRGDLLPLVLGSVQGEVAAEVAREVHHNVVAVLPARVVGDASGEETVALVASLPAGHSDADATAGVASSAAARGDAKVQAAALAELLGIATAFQALPEAPRRAVVFLVVEAGEDGLAGARRLLADERWGGHRLAGAVVLASGNVWGPTEDVTFLGVQASPLAGLVVRVAALQGRRVAADPAPWRGLVWSNPAWALLQAGVPTVLLEPGSIPLPPPAELPGMAAPVAAGSLAGGRSGTPPAIVGLVEDARLAFRVALELAEGDRPPRVVPARVQAALNAPPPLPAPTPVVRLARPRQPAAVATPSPTEAAGSPATTAEGSVASGEAPPPATPASSPAAVAPSPAPAATPTPPQRDGGLREPATAGG
jgi:hypothetical protein